VDGLFPFEEEVMRQAREFERFELVAELRRRGHALLALYQKSASLPHLVVDSVASNTFRAFANLAEPPSVIFREWAASTLTAERLATLGRIKRPDEFDAFHTYLVADLADYWHRRGKKPIAFGPRMKLINLLLKALVRWEGFTEDQRANIIPLLHVPLDRYSISAVRRFAEVGVAIPETATMSFVKTRDIYDKVQQLMREVAAEAGVAPICVDMLAWDHAHGRTMAGLLENARV
jgi:hypothetical protein